MSSVAPLATMRSEAFGAPGYGKSCAIVEAYNRHDEVYLTTAYLLRRLGYDVHVFNTWRNRIKDSFVHAPGVKPRITSSLNSLKVLTAAEQGSYDLVVFNTIEGAEVVGGEPARASQLIRPFLLVGHVWVPHFWTVFRSKVRKIRFRESDGEAGQHGGYVEQIPLLEDE